MKGAYCLVINVREVARGRIGSLGVLDFGPGKYVYVGSAMNSLEARIGRHLGKNKKNFWHIDHLLSLENVEVSRVLYRESLEREECSIAQSVNGEPVPGFGSSDCGCGSHLFRVSDIFFKKQWGLKPWE